MPRQSTAPSFVRDPNQAAELAALIRDAVTEMEHDYESRKDGLSRVARTQVEQAITRYRGWADELAPESNDEPAAPVRPYQIRPAANE